MKNIGVFGMGCIGSVLTKYLIQNPQNNYFFFNRSNKSEICIECNVKNTKHPIVINRNDTVTLDWILVCIKEYHYRDAVKHLKRIITPETKIAVFRNGLDLSQFFESFSDRDSILETIIDCPVQKEADGKYLQLRIPKIILPNCSLAIEFEKLFPNNSIEFTLTNEFENKQWAKLIESSSLGSLQVYTRQPCAMLQEADNVVVLEKLIQEGNKVAKSENVQLGNTFEEDLLNKIKAYPLTKGSSMLADYLAGNELELDAKLGVIIKKGRRNIIDTPVSDRMYTSLLLKK